MDDEACDVRDEYIEELVNGTDEAVLVGEMLAIGQDFDDYPVRILAGGDPMELRSIELRSQKQALQVIDGGADLLRWENSDLSRRRTVLKSLREKLESPEPRQTLPRRQRDTPLAVATERLWSPDGTVAAYVCRSIKPHPNAPMFCQACVEHSEGGSGLLAAHCEMEDVQLEWTDNDHLVITIPTGSEPLRNASWPPEGDVYRWKHGGAEKQIVLRFAPKTSSRG